MYTNGLVAMPYTFYENRPEEYQTKVKSLFHAVILQMNIFLSDFS